MVFRYHNVGWRLFWLAIFVAGLFCHVYGIRTSGLPWEFDVVFVVMYLASMFMLVVGHTFSQKLFIRQGKVSFVRISVRNKMLQRWRIGASSVVKLVFCEPERDKMEVSVRERDGETSLRELEMTDMRLTHDQWDVLIQWLQGNAETVEDYRMPHLLRKNKSSS